MRIQIDPQGTVLAMYQENIGLASVGVLSIRRASHVEPDEVGQWIVDLSPVGGPCLGPFSLRTEALQAEVDWLDQHLEQLR